MTGMTALTASRRVKNVISCACRQDGKGNGGSEIVQKIKSLASQEHPVPVFNSRNAGSA